ncbi:MAG: BatD family protein [Chloroflexota bacterium]
MLKRQIKTYAKQMMNISALIVALFLVMLQTGNAQSSPPVRASVDRATVTENDLVTLTLTIDTESDTPRVSLPDSDTFTTVRTSRGSQMNIVDGVVSRQYTYHYLLRPLQTGQLTINAVEVTIDGQTYNTDPIVVDVTSSTPPTTGDTNTPSTSEDPPQSLDFFVEAEVDNPNPYLGEQVVYTHRLYTAFRISQPNYDFPRFTGFWAEEEAILTERTGRANGRRYTIRETKVILFPTRTGPLKIDETIITSRSSIFNDGFVLKTEPIDLEVRALPSDAPADYDGAVGRFTLDVEIENSEVYVDDPLTMLVTLTGEGNVNTAPDPVWPEISEWRVFDAQVSGFSEFRNGLLLGNRVYQRLMVPGNAGNYTIPAIQYSYFDPKEQEFRTISSDPIEIKVLLRPGETAPPVVIGASKEEIERLGSDIRHIKPPPIQLSGAPIPLATQNSYWLTWLAPLVILAGGFAWSRRQQFVSRNKAVTRRTQAHKRAKRAISKARKSSPDLYIAAGQILNDYLADKFDQPVVGLTQDALAELLENNDIEQPLIEQVRACLVESDMGRFGPGGNEPDHAEKLLSRMERLIANLEKVFD